MNWENVQLVWKREMRDQLRDRRTLFVICVLPLMIYPMIGIAFSRLSQFIQHQDATVTLIGYEQLVDQNEFPQLIVDGQFNPELFTDQERNDRINLKFEDYSPSAVEQAQELLQQGDTDLVVEFPPGFADRLEQLRTASRSALGTGSIGDLNDPPHPVLYHDIRDASQLANTRVYAILARWKSQIVRSNLLAGRLPLEMTRPFTVNSQNIASTAGQQAAFWAKLLPFIVFICALTGAFYPAVDLCAGEKERGTLETLLTSPAQRIEIVGGKLLTVITFSIGSALCNLASMALTSQIIIQQLNQLQPTGETPLAAPSLASIAWLLVALVPMAVVFSAASLALASLARSTKEGQYYLMPLFLVCMPLMLLPMLPGIELTLATSVVPISGMVLLMQAAMEGNLTLAGTYALPVAIVTLGCCGLAIRWAVDQFNQESVLFRDTENFDLVTWVRHAYRNRPETPKLAAAGALISATFLAQFAMQAFPPDLQRAGAIEWIFLSSQLFCILAPTLFLAIVCIRSWRKTFLLDGPVPIRSTILAALLAVTMIPVGTALMEAIIYFVPVSSQLLALIEMLEELFGGTEQSASHLIRFLLLMAVLPAICEELAFRGFILSGLRSRLSAGWAVIVSALFFGLVHATALQQTVSAAVLGLVLGILAVKSRQITPCVVFHMGYNGMQLLRTVFADELKNLPGAQWVFRPTDSPVVGLGFAPWVVILAGLAAIALLWQVGPHRCRKAGSLGLQGDNSSPLPSAAPAEETGA